MMATPFRIRAPLRCDGIGRLDCAEDAVSGQRLAVRWLPLEANGDAAVKACEKLPLHPTLPRILHTGTENGSAFVAMDFPEGKLLATLVGDRLDQDAMLRMADDLSNALARLHDEGVVHGELSAESVLLAAGKALLWDMPLVVANRLTDRRGESRLMHNLVRIAPYLAPERARGGGASREADVYALGSILCIASGAPLPVADTTLGVVHLISNQLWAPRVPPTIPEPWAALIQKMIAHDPAARPNAREVATGFNQQPSAPLPTVPEFPAVRLPPELLATAAAMTKKDDAPQSPTREMPAVQTAEMVAKSEPGASTSLDDLTPVGVPSLPETPAAVEPVAEASQQQPAALEPVLEKTPLEPPSLTNDTPVSGETGLSGEAPVSSDTDVPEADLADVVKLPTLEMRAVTSPEVALAHNISVSPELAAHGARVMDPAPARTNLAPFVVIGVLAIAVLALTGVAMSLASRPPPPVVVQPVAQPVVPAPVVAPTPPPAAVVEEDDLAPLPRHRPRPTLEAPEPQTFPAVGDGVVTPHRVRPEDFDFLDDLPKKAAAAKLKEP